MADKTWIYVVGGLAIAGGLIYYFTKGKPQPLIPPGGVSADITNLTISVS